LCERPVATGRSRSRSDNGLAHLTIENPSSTPPDADPPLSFRHRQHRDEAGKRHPRRRCKARTSSKSSAFDSPAIRRDRRRRLATNVLSTFSSVFAHVVPTARGQALAHEARDTSTDANSNVHRFLPSMAVPLARRGERRTYGAAHRPDGSSDHSCGVCRANLVARASERV